MPNQTYPAENPIEWPPEEHEGEEGGDEVPSLLDGGGGGRMRSRNGGGRGLLSREATDYDTFGSIDSLIFEPKLNEQSAATASNAGGNKNEDIKKAHKVELRSV